MSRDGLQAAERDRLALLGADEDVLRRLAAWVGRDGTMGRVYAVDVDRVSVATAAGVTDTTRAVDSLPVIGDWVLVAEGEVVDVLPEAGADEAGADEEDEPTRQSRAEAYKERRDDLGARQRHKEMWKAREADGDSRARP